MSTTRYFPDMQFLSRYRQMTESYCASLGDGHTALTLTLTLIDRVHTQTSGHKLCIQTLAPDAAVRPSLTQYSTWRQIKKDGLNEICLPTSRAQQIAKRRIFATRNHLFCVTVVQSQERAIWTITHVTASLIQASPISRLLISIVTFPTVSGCTGRLARC
jgi:hypothetical protein